MLIRGKEYSFDFCNLVIQKYQEYKSMKKIELELKVPSYVISTILKNANIEYNPKKLQELKRNKICIHCQKLYYDDTKRMVNQTCSKQCAYEYGVQKRHEKGSYIRTEQQNEELSKTLRQKYDSGEFEHIRQISRENVRKYIDKIQNDAEYKKKVFDKVKQTSIEKYGVEHFTQHPDVKKKNKETNLKVYGFESPLRNEKVQNKVRETRIKRGLTYTFEGKTMKEWADEIGVSYTYFKQIVNERDFETAKKLSLTETNIEGTIKEFLLTLNQNFIYNSYLKEDDNNTYRPDFIIEDKKLIIECDGLFWHSDAIKKDKNYHKKKKQFYSNLNYNSLFFHSDEILDKKEIVQSIIKNKLGLSQRIFARKCKIQELDKFKSNEWFEQNHLMGKGLGQTFGLIYQDEIVCAIQVKWKNKQEKVLEISRFASKIDVNVVGGFSRLLKYSIKQLCPIQIQTFIDLRYGYGQYLKNLGFEKTNEDLSFGWTDGANVIHRLKYPGNAGYEKKLHKIWDCGQAKWIYRI